MIAALLILFADSYGLLRNTPPDAMTYAVPSGRSEVGADTPTAAWMAIAISKVATETWLEPHHHRRNRDALGPRSRQRGRKNGPPLDELKAL